MRIVIATSRKWNEYIADELRKSLGLEVFLITKKSELTFENLKKISPDYVFFPHWSYIIDKEIYGNFQCVIFHMTDLPFGRGGSPLQNLISRGFRETKMSAIKCSEVLDGGPVYLKRPLSLSGKAQEIFDRASSVILEMIKEIVRSNPTPLEQSGEVISFDRRTPSQSNLFPVKDLGTVYDHIRMLDAEGYPYAFLETENLRYEFTDAVHIEGDEIIAKVRIKRKSP